MSKFGYPRKGKTLSIDPLNPGELLHIDYSFWDLPSIRGFTSMHSLLMIKQECFGYSAPVKKEYH
jgi:hypothetical protein